MQYLQLIISGKIKAKRSSARRRITGLKLYGGAASRVRIAMIGNFRRAMAREEGCRLSRIQARDNRKHGGNFVGAAPVKMTIISLRLCITSDNGGR